MADDHEKNRAFGKPENLEKRLAYWARQLGTNKSWPWMGLGLIDDLRCACSLLGGNPDMYFEGTKPVERPAPAAPAASVEYDL